MLCVPAIQRRGSLWTYRVARRKRSGTRLRGALDSAGRFVHDKGTTLYYHEGQKNMPRKRKVITFSLPPEMDEQAKAGGRGGGPHRERASARGIPPVPGGEGVAQTGTDGEAALTPTKTGRDKEEEQMIERYDHTPAALYARVSSDRQDVDLSGGRQLTGAQGLRREERLPGRPRVYVDEAESGRIADRPEFRKMIDEAS